MTVARCPRCRHAIAPGQREHAVCGWKAAAPVVRGSPESWHGERVTEEQREGHMKRIREILSTEYVRPSKKLSREEVHEGSKLSGEERSLLRSQEEYDAEVAKLKADDARLARLARLRKAVAV